MSSLLGSQILDGLGKGLSIAGLALCMPFCFAFRQYLRFLDHLQLFFAFSIFFGLGINIFSNSLSNSWIGFSYNIYFICTPGGFVCTAGFPLSFASCLVLFLLAMRIIVAIEAWRKKDIRFQPVYTFFKGLSRWVYAPLCYYSVYFLILSIKGTSDSLLPSIVVALACVLFPILQLIGYKMIQTEKDNIMRKWLQFFNFYRILLICALVALGNSLQNKLTFYIVYGVYVAYAILFALKNNFHFPVLGRIVFVIGQAIVLAIYSFFIFKPDLLASYNIDFIGAAFILLLDLAYYIAQLVSFCKNGFPTDGSDNQKIAPEPSEQQRAGTKRLKKNAYDIDLNDVDNQFNNSKEQIITKQASPNKQNKARKRR